MLIDRARLAAALPAYTLGPQLGQGAFGAVLAGHHRSLRRNVAIKVLSRPDQAAGFRREARVLASMDHPHIVRVYDFIDNGDLLLIVMEYLGGGTLAQRRKHDITPEESCAAILAATAALSHAHSRDVLHRDLKGANMLFADPGDLMKVADFGIAKIMHGSGPTRNTIVGTPGHMAPEQVLGQQLSTSTDLYALGVVLHQLLTRRLPLDPALSTGGLVNHPVRPPMDVPAPIRAVLLRALEKNPHDRQPSARAFGIDLARAARSSYGPSWLERAGLDLHIDDEIRRVGTMPEQTARSVKRPGPRPTPVTDAPPAPKPRAVRTPDEERFRKNNPILYFVVSLVGHIVGGTIGIIGGAAVRSPIGWAGLLCLASAVTLAFTVGSSAATPTAIAGAVLLVVNAIYVLLRITFKK